MCLTHDPGIIAVTSCKYYFCIGDILGNAQNFKFHQFDTCCLLADIRLCSICFAKLVHAVQVPSKVYTSNNHHKGRCMSRRHLCYETLIRRVRYISGHAIWSTLLAGVYSTIIVASAMKRVDFTAYKIMLFLIYICVFIYK